MAGESARTLALVALLSLCTGAPVAAAPVPGPGTGPGGAIPWDPDTVSTVQGTVLAVERATRPGARSYGVRLHVRRGDGTVVVHLGPGWYVDDREPRFAKDDEVAVTGSRVTLEDGPAILARRVTRGEDVLELRDEDGIPIWAGPRRRR